MSILVVGNIIKDVYLNLDERSNHFETDGHQTDWLDLAFDGSKHHFFRRSSIFGGAAITLEVLQNFGLAPCLAGVDANTVKEQLQTGHRLAGSYRYILCHDHQISYLTPTERTETPWDTPTTQVKWIYIDRSAQLDAKLAQTIATYLSLAPDTRLALYLQGTPDTYTLELVNRATIVFTDSINATAPLSRSDLGSDFKGLYCQITDTDITLESIRQSWRHQNSDLKTHLTTYSIISATILASLLQRKPAKESLLLAKFNAEGSSLNGTLSLARLLTDYNDYQSARQNLRTLASSLVARPKGILAADESGGSIHKKFEAAHIPDDAQHRRDYRNIFFTTRRLEDYVNGVILFDETARQLADDGRNFTDFLTAKGIIPGIKVDQGLVNLPDSTEKYTQGLVGLPDRLIEYHHMGLRFAKWRAAFEVQLDPVDETVITPSDFAIQENCRILAQYAKMCQDAQIVPIVEPEVVHDGNYSIEMCAKITNKILDRLFKELEKADVDLKATILKVNMVLAGSQYATQSTPLEVGLATAETLKHHVPKDLAGVVFLSGGQGVEQATHNLQEVTNNGPYPWPVTFSFARALQGPALDAWQGNNHNTEFAQRAFFKRLEANAKALKVSHQSL